MITRIVKMEIEESKVDDFKTFLYPMTLRISSFDGCTHLDILNDKEDKTKFFSYSTWESEKHLENYRNSEMFKETWAKAKTFFAKDANAWTVENTFEK